MLNNIQYKTDLEDIKAVERIDNFEIKVDAGSVEKLPNGSIRFPASITRSGIFQYITNGKLVKEFRSPEEVFNIDSMATLRSAPITNEHPPEKISPENYSKYSKGALSDNIQQNNDVIDTVLTVNDKQLIEDILSGKKHEISCGYECQCSRAAPPPS